MVRRHAAVVVAIMYTLVPMMACEIRVRDSAFRTARDIHQLCVITDSRDEFGKEIHADLARWLDASADDLNVELAVVHADDPATNWPALGLPSAPPQLPVTVLIGRDNGTGTRFVIDHWEPAPTPEALERIAASPIRTELARQLATHVAVLLYAPNNESIDAKKDAEVTAMVQRGIAEERIGLSMIVLNRDDPDERLLCRFMGLRPGSADTLCVAFGRGKLMSPPLVGDEISAENIDQLVTQIRQACSCSKPLPTMGVDLPLIWSAAVDSTVILMDDELDLSTLADEVQTMLAAKTSEGAVSGSNTVATLVPIPSGAVPKNAATQTNMSAQGVPAIVVSDTTVAIVTSMVLIAIAAALALARRLGRTNSKR